MIAWLPECDNDITAENIWMLNLDKMWVGSIEDAEDYSGTVENFFFKTVSIR